MCKATSEKAIEIGPARIERGGQLFVHISGQPFWAGDKYTILERGWAVYIAEHSTAEVAQWIRQHGETIPAKEGWNALESGSGMLVTSQPVLVALALRAWWHANSRPISSAPEVVVPTLEEAVREVRDREILNDFNRCEAGVVPGGRLWMETGVPGRFVRVNLRKDREIQFEPDVIDRAIAEGFEVFERRNWAIENRERVWEYGRDAKAPCLASFTKLHVLLKDTFFAFHGGRAVEPANGFELVQAVPAELCQLSLRQVSLNDAFLIKGEIERLHGLKPTNEQPSIVAISKFLHGWNPGLFPMVDSAVIWNGLSRDRWLRDWLCEIVNSVFRVEENPCRDWPSVCDPEFYTAVVLLSAELLEANPTISEAFTQRLGDPLPDGVENVDAAALEFFLIGAVKLTTRNLANGG